ncbi:unnamed protein product [Rodentolepis nana]|uniref:Sema domain-containing protein n=1 Tax=Rodentolepis nana TaxID=102285 RepID=A0A0R3T5N2_RODNA|nr:unnamed protein product [Rodentolepis nana]
MKIDLKFSISTYFPHQIPPPPETSPVPSAKRPPDPNRTSRTLSTPLLPLEWSHLDLLIDQRFSKSSQRRRRYRRRFFGPSSHTWVLVMSTLLSCLLLLLPSLLPMANSAPSRTPPPPPPPLSPLSQDLNFSDSTFSSQDDSLWLSGFSDAELSGDLINPLPKDAELIQKKELPQYEEQEFLLDFETVDYQKETAIVDHNSQKPDYEESIQDLVAAGIAQTFDDFSHSNYRKLLFLPESKSLYAVADAATLLKLDGQSLKLSSSHAVPHFRQGIRNCDESKGCRERVDITVLTRTPQFPLALFCSSHYEERSRGIIREIASACVVPNPADITESLMQWDNKYYSSADAHRPPVVLSPREIGPEYAAVGSTNVEPFIYVAGVSADSLRISRLQMPDWSRFDIKWDGVLFTPKSNFLFNEPATIVMSFETTRAVYFLLREASKSRSGNRQIISRVIRVCRGDRGGVTGIGERYFGTMAKADLICQTESTTSPANGERAHFIFDFVQSAHWDSNAERLYTVFSTGEAGPRGSAICIYDLQSIEKAFQGPISNSNGILRSNSNMHKFDSPRPNPFPNVCERLAAGNLTLKELTLVRMGTNFYYRFEPITPLFGHAVVMSPSTKWNEVIGYQLPPVTSSNYSTSVLWISSDTHLTQFALHESHYRDEEVEISFLLSTCEVRRLRIGSGDDANESILLKLREGPSFEWLPHTNEKNKPAKERILRFLVEACLELIVRFAIPSPFVTYNISLQGEFVYLGTTHSIFRFQTDSCASYTNEKTCTTSGDPHCGWSSQKFSCISRLSTLKSAGGLALAVNENSPPKCKTPNRTSFRKQDTGWSPWHPCSLTKDLHPKPLEMSPELQRSCLCRICLSDTLCNFGEQQVSQCKFAGVWSPWSSWSRCEDKLRFRTRTCFNPLLGTAIPSSECIGDDREETLCLVRPFIPEEVGFKAMRAEQVALKDGSGQNIMLDKNNLVGMLVGIVLGVVFTLLLVFLVARFCRPPRRRKHPGRLRFHDISRSISNMQLERQIRHSLLHDPTVYANPSPIDQSMHSNSSLRYNFLHQSPPMNVERSPRSEEPLTTTPFYDRLSESTSK